MNDEFRKRAAAVALAGSLALTGIQSAKAESNDPLMESQVLHDQRQIEYIEFVQDNDLSDYDKGFVYYYRNGILKIHGKEYNLADLYLESGIKDGESRTFLIYYRFPKNDIVTDEEKGNFKRSSVLLLKDSFMFYEFYCAYKDLIVDNILELVEEEDLEYLSRIVSDFDGSMHVEAPETSYGRIKKVN